MLEQLFNSSVLDVLVPDTSIEYPPRTDTDEWLSSLKSGAVQRKQAFFDEQLQFFLVVRIDHPTPNVLADIDHPPADLLAFLAHLQVSLEATYISSVPVTIPDTPRSNRISAPVQTTSFAQFSESLHPHMVPPSTPNPTPFTAEYDRRYIRSEGTLLLTSIWGQDASEDSSEAFSLLWSQKESAWVAVYRLCVTVSFLRLTLSDPLLCLTVSPTLREKPLAVAHPKHPLAVFLAAHSALPDPSEPPSPTSSDHHNDIEEKIEINGLQEVNLLEGLAAGPTFSFTGPGGLSLSTTRLGGVTRRRLFSLPPSVPIAVQIPSPAPSTARVAQATLRKSFRKTLQTVSGFRVRMRTVFVPYVLLPEDTDNLDSDEALDERERREAGREERTVVLCVEVENSGDSGPGVGFAVEAVNVKIGGEGARTTLIGWGENGLTQDAEKSTFPLLVGPMEQYNLLYAVSFLCSPDNPVTFPLNRRDSTLTAPGGASTTDLQRAVTINIQGKPFLQSHTMENGKTHSPVMMQSVTTPASSGSMSFPTQTFSSRWNCVLDLSSHQASGNDLDDLEVGKNNALPEPPSPFPAFSPRLVSAIPVNSAFVPTPSPHIQAVAGSKRHTLSDYSPKHLWKSSTPTYYQASPLFLSPNSQHIRDKPPNTASKLGSDTITARYPSTPTTYAPPPSLDGEDDTYTAMGSALSKASSKPPLTPAYPAYPSHSALPPTPSSMPPIANPLGGVGPSVEIRRERGMVMGAAVPQTPGPTIATAFREQGVMQVLQNVEDVGQSIIVSIGLLPLIARTGMGKAVAKDKICPLDQFTLDIFVFNQSSWTRRFEVSCPYRRRRRKQDARNDFSGMDGSKDSSPFPGILPLDNRVRIGPLRPATCQSVRMEFLALVPGVHTLDVLTLTDVESGFAMNLRSVMDVVVHEPSS